MTNKITTRKMTTGHYGIFHNGEQIGTAYKNGCWVVVLDARVEVPSWWNGLMSTLRQLRTTLVVPVTDDYDGPNAEQLAADFDRAYCGAVPTIQDAIETWRCNWSTDPDADPNFRRFAAKFLAR